MTGQSLLDLMEVMDQDLQLQAGEDDVVNGLLALNAAQDIFEVIAAGHKGFFGGKTTTVTTTASTETTSYPTGFLRIDRLQFIDPTTSRPAYDLRDLEVEGGHVGHSVWPLNLVSAISTGAPVAYVTDGTNIYWDPLPSATHTVRVYGFQSADDISAAGTFAYPDAVAAALASYSTRILRSGKDDPADLELARELFDPMIQSLKKFNRSGASRPVYTQTHDC